MTAPVLTKAPNPGTSNNSNTVALPAAFSVPNGAALVLQVNAYQYLGFNPVSTVSIGAYTATLIVKNDPDTATQGGANLTSFYYWKNTTGSAQSITPSVTFSGVNAHNAIWAEYWTGFDTTTFFDAVTSANALESAYPSPIDTITLPTRGDDVLRIGTSFTYGSTATSSNAGQVDIGEEAGGGAYSAAAYKVAVTNSTTAGFTKDVSYGAATVGFVLRTAAPVTISLGSVTVEIVGGATSVGVDQTVQVRWRALSTTSQPFTGATITPSGYNSSIASANPSGATGLSDTNGYYTVTMTGVSPGSLTFAGSATYSGTTVNVGASATLAVNGGIGGVSILSAPTYTPTVDVGQSALRMSVGETKAIQCKFKSPLSGAAIIGYMPTAAATVPGSATVAVSGVTDSYGIATVSITALKVGDIVVNVT